MVGFWIRAGKTIAGKTIVGTKPKVKFKGQKSADEIKKKGKEFKEKIIDEDFKENMTRYFTNQPPKKIKKTKTKSKSKVRHFTAPKGFTW